MIRTILRRTIALVLFVCALALPSVGAQDVPPFNRDEKPGPPPAVPGPNDKDAPEVQGRGPVHEGFAQPNGTPRPGPAVDKAPPDPIPEQPPEQRPEGDNVVWVPGYWSWDADKGDFLWVSGFWRVAPAGRKWLPGYWTKTDNGWQWVSGFWAPGNLDQMPYAPEPPPASLDVGPSIPPPSDDYYYVPGNWVYQGSRYLWSPGFWCRPQPGFVWCPPRWNWTPRGYLYVGGFWDRNLGGRGVLFAPVYFPKPLWNQRGWAFTPSYVVPTRALVGSLWVRPGVGQYAYGDYYAARYARAGYQPWATYGAKVRDPLYSYYRWANRGNPAWQRSLVTTHQARVNGDATLPPRTLAAQNRLRSPSADLIVAQPLSKYRSDSVRLKQVTTTERATHARYAESLRKVTTERRTVETQALRRNERPAPLSLNRVPAPHAADKARVQTTQKSITPTPQPKPRQYDAPRIQTQPKPRAAETYHNVQTAPRIQATPQPKVYSQPAPLKQQAPARTIHTQPAPQFRSPPPAHHAPPQMRAPAPRHSPPPAHHAAGGHGHKGR